MGYNCIHYFVHDSCKMYTRLLFFVGLSSFATTQNGCSLGDPLWNSKQGYICGQTIMASRRQGQQKMNDQITNLKRTIPLVHILTVPRALTIWAQFFGESTQQNQQNQERSWKGGNLGGRDWKMTLIKCGTAVTQDTIAIFIKSMNMIESITNF